MHYRPSISRNLIRNGRLQKWLVEEGKTHIVYDEALGFCKPDYTFNVVLCLNHLLWNQMYEGVGMRQMMDLYFVLRQVPKVQGGAEVSSERKMKLLEMLKHLKLLRFASACLWIVMTVFRLEDKCLLCVPNEHEGKFLLDEIMKAGNFGKHDERLNKNRYTNHLLLMKDWLRHNWRLINFFPKDVIWTPAGILWISMWKKMN